MKEFIRFRWLTAVILLLIASLACGSMPSIPGIPTFPPKPGKSNVPTGISPLSGDWNADTKFGHLAFTVDPDGNNVTTAVINMSGWRCGGTILSTELQVLNSWSISDGEFTGDVDLDDSHFHTMTIDGSYDKSGKAFSGTWEEDSHGTTCSGQWEAVPRK
jgi:hypothetical protein